MELQLVPVLERSFDEFCHCMSRGFADYAVRIPFDLAVVSRMVRYYGVDLQASRTLLGDGEAIGGALIGRRGWESRLAAMALVPEARGKGAGAWMVQRLLEESKDRQERRMSLEVIADNQAALKVYERSGFVRRRYLVGYVWPEAQEIPACSHPPQLQEIDFRVLAQRMASAPLADLPWQVAPECFYSFGPPNVAIQRRDALIAISSPHDESVAIRGLWVEPSQRRRGQAKALLQALMARYPHRSWKVPPLFAEGVFAPLFEGLGFERSPISQWQMLTEFHAP